MEQTDQMQIFLSYASQDRAKVLEIYDFLVANGFPNTWMDCKKLLPGQQWEFEIQKNLRKSEVVIFFLSNTSVNKRGFVQKELKKALALLEEKLSSDTYLIPVKLDPDVIVPQELAQIQYLDITVENSLAVLKQTLEEQVERLGLLAPTNAIAENIHIQKRLVSEKWEGLPGYEVEFAVPIFHSGKYTNIGEISRIIEGVFLTKLQHYRRTKLEQLPDNFSWSDSEFLRTNTLDAHYGNIFHSGNVISIHYSVSWYGAGAAHPNHHFQTFNYLLNPLVRFYSLEDLFVDTDAAFQAIIKHTHEELMKIRADVDDGGTSEDEPLLEKEWVERGTSDWESLSAFIFSEVGVEIYFPPYQVGPYALGAQFVTIPYKLIHPFLKNEIRSALHLPYTMND